MSLHANPITLDGSSLTMAQMAKVCDPSFGARFRIDEQCRHRLGESIDILQTRLASGEVIYGVNTRFGGMAKEEVTDCAQLQSNLIQSHHAGSGPSLPIEDVKLAMLLRANSLCKGVSAIRPEIIERYLSLLNQDVIPDVRQHGSLGASGDLVPLSAIAGSVLGLSDDFHLYVDNQKLPAKTWLNKQSYAELNLSAKEGLALINGTSCHLAIAINAFLKLSKLFDLTLMLHAMVSEVMGADARPFSAFVQSVRPHPGQKAVATQLRTLLKDSEWVSEQRRNHDQDSANYLAQQRYSIRCIPQFLGPIYEDMQYIGKTLEIEANSASDNPLIDPESQQIFHGGNFLGQHTAIAMDKIRMFTALMAKHNDAQIAMLVEPAFNDGLPACLYDETDPTNIVGVKPLQINSNSLIPLIEKLADPICTRFPVYAEQFNQNINSQAFNAATLASEGVSLYEEQLAISLLIAKRAKDLRQQQKPHVRWSSASEQLCQALETAMASDVQQSHTATSFQHQIQTTKAWLQSSVASFTHHLVSYNSWLS